MFWFRKRPKATTPSQVEGYAFCEPTTATGFSSWHIRELGPEGKKLGGGVTTKSLCGHVRPYPSGIGGWDLDVPITEHHLGHACPKCVQEFRRRIAK
jgi:hypothetical protein